MPAAPAPTEALPGSFRILRDNPGFLRLYLAHSLSLLGDWFNTIAVLTLLSEMTGSSAQSLGWVLILKLLPNFFMGPIAGVTVDRMSRRGIMVGSDLIRAAVVLNMLWVAIFPVPGILYLATVLQVAVSAFFEPARTASIPNLVPPRALPAANALGAATWSAMFTLGAAVGGVFTHAFGWEAAIIFDAATYLASAAIIRTVNLPHRSLPRRGRRSFAEFSGWRDAVEGLRFLRHRTEIASIVLVKAAWGVAGAVTLLLTVFGQRIFSPRGGGALGIAALYTARAIGTGIGPILARRITRGRPGATLRIIGWSFVWSGAWYAAFAAAPNLRTAAVFVLIAHLGGSTLWVFSTVLLQQMVPDELRGRIFSAEMGLMTLTTSVSTFVYGWLLDVPGLPPRGVVVALAATMALPGIWYIRAARRGARSFTRIDGAGGG